MERSAAWFGSIRYAAEEVRVYTLLPNMVKTTTVAAVTTVTITETTAAILIIH